MFSRFLKNANGNVAIMFALGSVLLLSAVGGAIDFGRLNESKTVMQGAADAAALAAATSGKLDNPAVATKIVNNYIDGNRGARWLYAVTTKSAGINPPTGNYRVVLFGRMTTSFLAFASFSSFEITAVSEVNVALQGLELALILDNTGSMSGCKIDA